jgi:hypothetical protein
MPRLTKEQKEVWDRLKNGIPKTEQTEFDYAFNMNDEIRKAMAEQIKKEIDDEIIKDLLDAYSDISSKSS